MDLFKLTIKGRIPSKKNSKRIIMVNKRGSNGSKVPTIISSEAYLEWEASLIPLLKQYRGKFEGQKGMTITCTFVLPDNRDTDLSNKFESVADLLCHEKVKIIDDDNSRILSNVHLHYGGVDTENPRVEIILGI